SLCSASPPHLYPFPTRRSSDLPSRSFVFDACDNSRKIARFTNENLLFTLDCVQLEIKLNWQGNLTLISRDETVAGKRQIKIYSLVRQERDVVHILRKGNWWCD